MEILCTFIIILKGTVAPRRVRGWWVEGGVGFRSSSFSSSSSIHSVPKPGCNGGSGWYIDEEEDGGCCWAQQMSFRVGG